MKSPPPSTAPAELQTKDQLIEKIKEWVRIDNEIRTLQTELNTRNENKKKVSTELMNVMKRNEIDVFDIKDGQIIYDRRNVKKPVTKAALLSILSNYYNGDAVKAAEINQYIMDNREEVVREKIIRKSRGTNQETYGFPNPSLN
jgi:seryl-tRNA synthetase